MGSEFFAVCFVGSETFVVCFVGSQTLYTYIVFRKTDNRKERKKTYQVYFAVTPEAAPKEVAKEATPPAPECAQGVKAQGL